METVLKVLEWVLEHHESLLSLLVVVVGLIKHFDSKDKAHLLETTKQKAKAIVEVVPACVRIVDEMAELIGSDKAKVFIVKVEKALKALGWEMLPEDVEGIQILGSAQHKENREFKEFNDSRK